MMDNTKDMEHPYPRLSELRRLCKIARKLSTLEVPSDPWTYRTIYAEQLFEKIVLISHSFLKLLPESNHQNTDAYDISSFASLARNVIECHNVFQYLCVDHISKQEFEFRLWLMNLHHSVDSERILNALRLPQRKRSNSPDIADLMPEFVLKRNVFFNSLDERVRNELLKGKKPYYWRVRRSSNVPISKILESALYNFFSNSIHSFPLGIHYSSVYVKGHHLNLYSLYFLSIEAMIIYLASAVRSYIKLRRKYTTYITRDEGTFVVNCIGDSFIQEWIKYRSWYTDKYL